MPEPARLHGRAPARWAELHVRVFAGSAIDAHVLPYGGFPAANLPALLLNPSRYDGGDLEQYHDWEEHAEVPYYGLRRQHCDDDIEAQIDYQSVLRQRGA